MKSLYLKVNRRNVLSFLYLGLCWVFPLGLLSLTVGPNRWMADYAAKHQWSEDEQSMAQKVVIVLFLIVVLFLTTKTTQYLTSTYSPLTLFKKAIWGMLSLGFIVSLYIFSFQPEILTTINTSTSVDKSATAEYHFGPYPDEEKLRQLKHEGYDGVISLLNELVVPAEPILMNKEKINAKSANIKLISIPMLPWVSKNDSTVIMIRKMAHKLKGKYYVHCYLGKDRANAFKNIIRKETGHTVKGIANSERKIDSQTAFERGPIFKLEAGVYFTPCPTDEELLTFILNGQINSVVCLLNPDEKGDAKLIEFEKQAMEKYNQFFVNHPVTHKMTDAAIIEKIKTIKTYKKPIVIHAFFSDNTSALHFRKLYLKESQKTIKK
ncbi:MAG: hypothetical protein RL607_802 [Bacteroidota bacterium]|jgi:hypothetical protein